MPESKNDNVSRQQTTQRQWVEGLLVSAQNRRWYGRITIEIKKGLIDVVKSEESLKPPALVEGD